MARWTVQVGEQVVVVETTGDGLISVHHEWAAVAQRRLCWVADLARESSVRARRTDNDDLALLVAELDDVLKGRFDGQAPAGEPSEYAPLPGPLVTDRDTIADLRRKLGLAIGATDTEQRP